MIMDRMLRTRFLPIIVSLILIFFIRAESKCEPSLQVSNLYKASDRILIAAHRGSHSQFPDNSIPAIAESIKNGIDIVEIDIRETKDKVPVLLHDKTLTNTTQPNYKVAELKFEELNNYPLLFKGKETTYKIPSLEEVLQYSKNKIILNLDFKLDDLKAMKRAYELVKKYDMEESVIFTVNNLDLIPSLHQINPDIRIMPVAFSARKIRKVMKCDFIDILQLSNRSYCQYNSEKFDTKEIDIWVNSLKKYDKMQQEDGTGFEKLLRIKKVDIIQTDYPEELLDFLQKQGLHD